MDHHKEEKIMGRKKATRGDNISITKNALKYFKIWDSQRTDRTVSFKQCKDKKYWFVSDNGIVVSFYKRTEPLFMQIETSDTGYKYIVTKDKDNRTKTYYIHRLQAEAFDVYAYGKKARKRTSLSGLEVHHAESDKRNKPESLEILEPEIHDALFDKKNVPSVFGDDKKNNEYMQKIAEISEEHTPNQSVVVFSGAGIVNGEETKDLTQVIYADDFEDAKEVIDRATYELYKPQPTIFTKEGYLVFYSGTPYAHTVIATYNKELLEHIKRADAEEHMEEDTKYPITVKDGDNSFVIYVMKI